MRGNDIAARVCGAEQHELSKPGRARHPARGAKDPARRPASD
jgi:hypothetical protein